MIIFHILLFFLIINIPTSANTIQTPKEIINILILKLTNILITIH